MFASRTTKDVVIAGDDGSPVTVTIQKLSKRALDKAREAQLINASRQAQALGAVLTDAIQKRQASVEQKAADPAEVRFQLFDQIHVLEAGVVRWTIIDVEPKDGIADLDEETADILFREIVKLSVPTPEEQEAERGKSSSSSTGTSTVSPRI